MTQASERFTLYRDNPVQSIQARRAGQVLWVMLNPSTADAIIDDPTIRRVMGFSWREGFGALAVVNLFAQRSTDPKHLITPARHVQIQNIETIEYHIDRCSAVVAAWGTTIPKSLMSYAKAMIGIIRLHADNQGKPIYRLGVTANGSPRHPLYVKADVPFQVWPVL